MRLLFLFAGILSIFSCNVSMVKSNPNLHSGMPRPWEAMKFEEEYLPYKGGSFEPVCISDKDKLIGLLKWLKVDSAFHEIFNFERENVIVTFRPENDGAKKYSLWMNKLSNVIFIKKDDLAGYDVSVKHTQSYIYFYRIPKLNKDFDLRE